MHSTILQRKLLVAVMNLWLDVRPKSSRTHVGDHAHNLAALDCTRTRRLPETPESLPASDGEPLPDGILAGPISSRCGFVQDGDKLFI
jgi:hypothetical protein